MPIRMNKNDITVLILITDKNADAFPDKEPTEYDDVFRQSEGGKKSYSDPIVFSEVAQFKNKKFQRWGYKDESNVGSETDARIVIDVDDFDEITASIGCELKKGDIITSIAGNTARLIIDEVRPTGFLNGRNTLYFLMLKDHNVPMGGVV